MYSLRDGCTHTHLVSVTTQQRDAVKLLCVDISDQNVAAVGRRNSRGFLQQPVGDVATTLPAAGALIAARWRWQQRRNSFKDLRRNLAQQCNIDSSWAFCRQ